MKTVACLVALVIFFVYYLVRSVSGRTSSGYGVFLCKLFEGDLLGMLDRALLLHDGMLHSLLLGDHGSHSVVLLFQGFCQQFYFIGFSGSLSGEVINVFLLNRDGVGAGGLLSNLLLQKSSHLLLILEISHTLRDEHLSLTNDLGKSSVSLSLSFEELLERLKLVSGSALVEHKVHVVPSTTRGTSISDKRARSLLPSGSSVGEASSSLDILGFAGRCGLGNNGCGRGSSDGNYGSRSKLKLESRYKRAALGDSVEALVGNEVGVGGDVVSSASRLVNNARSVAV